LSVHAHTTIEYGRLPGTVVYYDARVCVHIVQQYNINRERREHRKERGHTQRSKKKSNLFSMTVGPTVYPGYRIEALLVLLQEIFFVPSIRRS
jgi:hypothetical protein